MLSIDNPFRMSDMFWCSARHSCAIKQGQLEVSQRIQASNRRQLPFIHFIQEPMVIHERAAWQPTSCKKFGVQRNPRTLIYTDINRPAWFVESLSNSDITVIQTTINNRSTLLVSLYLDITWIKGSCFFIACLDFLTYLQLTLLRLLQVRLGYF